VIERRRKAAIAFAIGVFVVVSPLVLRNQSVNGSQLRTRSGMNLFLLFYAAVALARVASLVSEPFFGKTAGRYNHVPCP
jgi:hypothetical protein